MSQLFFENGVVVKTLTEPPFQYSDGGRSKYFKGTAGDCFTRAVCNATGMDYKVVYDMVNEYGKKERTGKRKKDKSSARDGVYQKTALKIMKDLGWSWVPTMSIGSGCTVHVATEDLPCDKTIILRLSGHFSCMKNGILLDTYDCSRGASRCVYGYWVKA